MGRVIKGRKGRVISDKALNVHLLAVLSEDSGGDAGRVAATRVFLLTPVLFLIMHRLEKRTFLHRPYCNTDIFPS